MLASGKAGLFPLDVIFPARHTVAMSEEPKSILQIRLQERLTATGEKPATLSARLGQSTSFIRDVLRGKTKSPRAQSLEVLATALRTTTDYLLGKTDIAEADEVIEATVPLVGYVGAGAEAHFYATGDGELDRVPAPDGATPDTVAVEIRGESLGALFEHWIVYYDEVRSPVTPDMYGKLCVVGLADDKVLVKQIKPSKTAGYFPLLSNTEGPILDAIILWAAKVKSMVPR